MSSVLADIQILTSHQNALRWLSDNKVGFPAIEDQGPEVFNGWRFALFPDGVVRFTNFIEPAISRYDVGSIAG